MKPVRLMRKMMIPISAKFMAKRRHQIARHVTFIYAQIACMSILVIWMSLSSHIFISMCHMASWALHGRSQGVRKTSSPTPWA